MARKDSVSASPGHLPTAELPPCAGDVAGGVDGPKPSWVLPSGPTGPGGYRAARDDDFAASTPVLFDWLTLSGLGGKGRVVGSLLIFCEDGKWKSCLNDRDGGNYAFHSSDTFKGLLESLDKGLKSGHLDWRKSKSKR